MGQYDNRWQTVKVTVEQGIAWVSFNRPEKRNAMSPTLNREMRDVLETVEQDADARQTVEDDEELHQKRRAADDPDIEAGQQHQWLCRKQPRHCCNQAEGDAECKRQQRQGNGELHPGP